MTVYQWHVVISGYTQNYGSLNGSETLWGDIDDALCSKGPGVRVLYFPWNAPWREIAEMIKRNSVPSTEVFIYAYSWGAGYGFVTLAQQLEDWGVSVRHAVLCDPVWRRPGIPAFFQWVGTIASYFGRETIAVPTNVLEVSWCYQRNSKPDGDRPVAAKGSRTRINAGFKLRNAVHTTADESQWFQSRAMEVALKG